MNHKGLNQLLCAALVSDRFREALLRNPAQAIAAGYLDQRFSLTAEEHKAVVGIQAQQFEDFAAQVYCWLSGNGNGSRARSNGQNGWSHNGALGSVEYNGHKRYPMAPVEPLANTARVTVAA